MLQRRPEEIEPAGQEAVDEEEAGDARGLGRADREAPSQRQPFEVHREHELQDDGEPEGGNRQAADGDDAHDVVEGGVVPDRGQRAERYADERGEQQREEGELDGGGEAARDIARDRAAGVGGVAEVGLRHLAQVDEELLPDRLVEAVGLADGGDLGRRRVLAGERGRGIVGQDPQHDEGEDQQAEQRRHDQQQAAQDEAGHAISLARRSPPP